MSLLATGSSMSSIFVNDVVANLMLSLQGVTEITISFLSPINFDTSWRRVVVAVAVNASMFTDSANKLLNSLIRSRSFRNVSPL